MGTVSPHPRPRRHTTLFPAPTVFRPPLWDSASPPVCACAAPSRNISLPVPMHGALAILFPVLSGSLSSSPPLPPPPGRVLHTPPAALQAL